MSEDTHRRANVSMVLQSITDKELIEELRERKLFAVVECGRMYYAELASDDKYMATLNADIAKVLADILIEKKFMMVIDRPVGDGKSVARSGSVIIFKEPEK